MMTLEEAIKHCKDVALSCSNKECALEHFQLLKWLQEYSDMLKKQGEQKPTDKVGPKFHKGQWIVWKEKCYKVNYNGCGYELFDQNGLSTSWGYKDVEDNAHLWTIEDAKKGDVLASENGWTCIFNCLNDNLFSSHCFMDDEGWFCEDGGQAHTLNSTFGEIHPATKEQRDLLFKKMHEAGYKWDTERKELKKTNEEFNGEDYGIGSLFHAKRILEKTLGKVDGYQSDDGILDHKCAITTVKKLYKQKPIEWHREDEHNLNACLGYIPDEFLRRWLKDVIPVKYDKSAWSEEDENQCINTIELVKNANDCAGILDKETALNWLKSLKERVYLNANN